MRQTGNKATYGVPLDTSKFTGQQFVAGEDPLQTSAIAKAEAGVGSYEPYLQAAQAGLGTAGTDVAAARTAAGGLRSFNRGPGISTFHVSVSAGCN